MQLYSVRPGQRARQVGADALALVVLIVAVLLGIAVGTSIAALGEAGRQLGEAGDGLRGTMTDASGTLGGIPLIGRTAAAPFARAGDVGSMLADAGAAIRRGTGLVGLLTGALIALIPALVVIRARTRAHLRFGRRAEEARALLAAPDGDDLLALRALATAPAAALRRTDKRPAGAWRRGDPAVVRALADLEIEAAGIRR